MKRVSCIVFATFALLGTTIVAHAAVTGFFADTTKKADSGASGHSGADRTIGVTNGFLYAISWSENGDRPCWFRVYGAYFENGKWNTKQEETTLGDCKEKESSLRTVQLYPPQTPLTDAVSNARFVRGIQVCTSEKRGSEYERLKGIRVKAARTGSDLSFPNEKDNSTEEQYRSHCKTWESWATCPDGTAATALTIQYTENEGARGLRLVCAPPTQSKPVH